MKRITSIFAIACIAVGAPVLAQEKELTAPEEAEGQSAEATGEESTHNSARTEIEEVVVTAQKRAQTLTDIPMSINAFTSEQMRELNMTRAIDIAIATPGLVGSNTTGTPVFAIRGVGLDDYHPNNTSGVGTYIDEVNISSAAMLEFQLFDYERVEVLKGPQGTLYGRNTTGGAINYVSKKPTKEAEGYVELGFGRWSTLDTTVAAGGPISDKVGYRVAVHYINAGEGFQQDVSNGTEAGQPDNLAYRGMIDWEISNKANLLLNIHGGRDRSRISGWQAWDSYGLGEIFGPIFGYPMASPGVPDEIATGDGFTSIGGPVYPFQEMDDIGAYANLKVDIGPTTLTSITAYDTSERQRWDNVDGSAWAINDDATYSDINQFSQEFRLDGSSDRLSWVAGVFLFSQNVDGNQSALITNTVDIVYADLGIPIDFWPSTLGVPSTVSSVYTQDTEALGVFGQIDWNLGDRWRLTTGLRYSHEKVSFDGFVADDQGFFTGTFEPTIMAELDDSQTDSQPTGRINIDFTPNENWLLYANLSSGFKSGVYFTNPVPDPVGWGWAEPEELLAFEAGFKSTLASGGLQLNGAGFFYDYKNKQVLTDVTFPGGVAPTLWNIPKSEIWGLELDLDWIPTRGLEIRGGIAWLQSEVTDAPTEIRGFPYDQVQEGDTLSWSPEWTYSATIRYGFDLSGSLTMALQGDYSYRDKLQPIIGVGIVDESFTDELILVGARASIGAVDGRWEAALWGRNLNDGAAVTYTYTNFLSDRSYSLQKPLSWGATFIYRW